MKPRLLMVTPALPRPTGGGLRMRAWQFLCGAARDHRVTLVTGSPAFPAENREVAVDHLELVERCVVLPWLPFGDPELLWRRLCYRLNLQRTFPHDWAQPTRAMRARLSALDLPPFERSHVHRLYMLPVALEILGRDPSRIDQLDLDDWESRCRQAIAALAPQSPAGRREAAAGRAYAELERHWLPRLRRILVCSTADRNELDRCHPEVNSAIVPNTIAVPLKLPPLAPKQPPRLLFVGSLGYGPNLEGLHFFLEHILPALRRRLPGLLLEVIGPGASAALDRELATTAGICWQGARGQIDSSYAAAGAVIAPLRAGGGTRLKVLEAFAHGRPLVATAITVHGLEVRDRVHYLRAESVADWVEACSLALAGGPEITALTRAAYTFVQGLSLESGVTRVAKLLSDSEHKTPAR